MDSGKIMKKFALFIAAMALSIGSLCAAYKQEDMLLYARTKPLKGVVPKFMRFAKEIVDDKYFESSLHAFGLMLGHPNYEGFSQKEGAAMFLFEGGSKKNILFAAKFDKNSPIKADLIRKGLALKDVKGWTLITFDREALDGLTNVDWMLDIAGGDVKNDIEICPSVNKLVENMNIDVFKKEMGPSFGEKIDRVAFLFYTIRDEIDELHRICLAGNFDGPKTTILLQLKAKLGSDIGALWSAKVGGTTELPQLVFDVEPYISLFANSNAKENRTFTDKLNHKILKNCSYSDLDVLLKKIMEKSKKFANKENGQGIFHTVPDGENMGVLGIVGGKCSDADVKAMMDCDANLEDLISHCVGDSEIAKRVLLSPKFEHKSQYTYRKETVHFYGLPSGSEADSNEESYACACNGNFVIATSKALVEKAIDNILDNETRISLKEGHLCQASINLRQIANGLLSENGSSSSHSLGDMKPVDMEIICGNNAQTIRVTFDNVSFREFGKILVSSDSNAETSKEELSSEKDETANQNQNLDQD
ncbi:MAG: hypothetical protein LBJ94_02095 [Puniceicoccales bacterium]|nr:hypothetical protein [Puniceicoccales bacterium]